MIIQLFDSSALDLKEVSRRRHRLIMLVVLIAGPAILTMADLHWRTGYDIWRIVHLLLFTVLFGLIALGTAQALIGYKLRREGGDTMQITASLAPEQIGQPVTVRLAVVMPICNEEVDRVIEGMKVIYESVVRTGKLPHCDFFFLSDSTDPNHWIQEEAGWLALTQKLDAHGKIFYRKRRVGINKKAGNIADFCRRWGSHYRYMVVLDADSIMTGDAIVTLARLMEKNRHVGIIQGVPKLVNGETMLARMQQFASRLYGPISAAGLNYWQLSEANYWGHNAIIRLEPFIRHCSLPELPGEGPFSGRIMSHDYVEAALMRRAGWAVWLATEVEGNYEECPGSVIEFAQRDRRWLQGNLQHTRLIAAKGFHAVNRLHFSLGILSYLSSPLWLAFLVVSVAIAYQTSTGDVVIRPVHSFADYLHWGYHEQAVSLSLYTLAMLFLPKIMALFDLKKRPDDILAFGGWPKVMAGVFAETLAFTLLAPVLMLYHAKFFILTLCSQKISWGKQRRGRAGASAVWETIAAHAGHTVAGLIGLVVVININLALTLWMSPILFGLIFSIPLSYATSSLGLGARISELGLFKTPEESRPIAEIQALGAALEELHKGAQTEPELTKYYGLLQAVLDPYVNAVHVSLLHKKDEIPSVQAERFAGLRKTLKTQGPSALKPADRMALLMDENSMTLLHDQIWFSSPSHLAKWWRLALRHYEAMSAPPQTALTRPANVTN